MDQMVTKLIMLPTDKGKENGKLADSKYLHQGRDTIEEYVVWVKGYMKIYAEDYYIIPVMYMEMPKHITDTMLGRK